MPRKCLTKTQKKNNLRRQKLVRGLLLVLRSLFSFFFVFFVFSTNSVDNSETICNAKYRSAVTPSGGVKSVEIKFNVGN